MLFRSPKNFVSVNGFTINCNLPIQFESVQLPNYNFGATAINQPTNQYSITPSDSILHSFIPDYSILQNVGSDFIFAKTDTWDFIQILGKGALTSISFSISFTVYSGQKVPLYLLPTTSCSVKIGFFKKELFNTRGKELLYQMIKENEATRQIGRAHV